MSSEYALPKCPFVCFNNLKLSSTAICNVAKHCVHSSLWKWVSDHYLSHTYNLCDCLEFGRELIFKCSVSWCSLFQRIFRIWCQLIRGKLGMLNILTYVFHCVMRQGVSIDNLLISHDLFEHIVSYLDCLFLVYIKNTSLQKNEVWKIFVVGGRRLVLSDSGNYSTDGLLSNCCIQT